MQTASALTVFISGSDWQTACWATCCLDEWQHQMNDIHGLWLEYVLLIACSFRMRFHGQAPTHELDSMCCLSNQLFYFPLYHYLLPLFVACRSQWRSGAKGCRFLVLYLSARVLAAYLYSLNSHAALLCLVRLGLRWRCVRL